MSPSDDLFFILPAAALAPGASPASMGAKAHGLLQLARLGASVPPAFVLGTGLSREYFENAGRLPARVHALLDEGIAQLERVSGRRFGGVRQPLLLSVRSGAPVSMPGMMETLLNVGLGERTLPGLLRASGNPRLVRDCYRRLISQYMQVVHGAAAAPFDAIVQRYLTEQQLGSACELDSASLGQIASESLAVAVAQCGVPFPQSPREQLLGAVEAVFRSWGSEKARHYRRLYGIEEHLGTAVTVQQMVFGNAGADSGAGVGFTRDPATGERRPCIEFLFNAQGEDVVGGRHAAQDGARLARALPQVAAELQRLAGLLEGHFHDMQDFEFTVENGRLYLLQTRSGKRTPWAALRIAIDLAHEELITPAQALEQLQGIDLEHLERTRLADAAQVRPLAQALGASIGVASGAVVLDAQRAVRLAGEGREVILVRPDIQTQEVEAIAAAAGVLTAAGARTSHAAVVARQLGKVCLVGCEALHIEPQHAACVIGGRRIAEGDEITLDADSGLIYPGRLDVQHERPLEEIEQVRRWRREAA